MCFLFVRKSSLFDFCFAYITNFSKTSLSDFYYCNFSLLIGVLKNVKICPRCLTRTKKFAQIHHISFIDWHDLQNMLAQVVLHVKPRRNCCGLGQCLTWRQVY